MNWKIRFLPLLLAAALALGSVTAFADGEPVGPVGQDEVLTTLAAGETFSDGNLTYKVNDDGQTVTLTNGSNATGDIIIPEMIAHNGVNYSVTAVGWNAFENSNYLTSITFNGNIDTIGGWAFSSCRNLATVTFKGNIGTIGDCAFSSCLALKAVNFNGNVGTIGWTAFTACKSLKTITFKGDVSTIWEDAFMGCVSLETVYVPTDATDADIKKIQDDFANISQFKIKIERLPADPDPVTPSEPAADGSSTTTTATGSSSVQQLETAERPDPMDVEANERYNFWMDVKSDLRAAADGEKVRIHVPADYTNMPASVMETIRTLETDVTLDLRWSGARLLITPQTALKRPPLKAFWTLSQLCEEYAR